MPTHDVQQQGRTTLYAQLPDPTLVLIPCFSGAPWTSSQVAALGGHRVTTMRLPENVNDVAAYADFVAAEVRDLDSYVLVGDSFGAVIALELAIRQPIGLVGLVLSGGFATNPLPHWKAIASRASRFAGGPLYRQGTLRFHASQLASDHDADAPVPHTQDDYRTLFVENTPRSSYTARVTSVLDFDVRDRLSLIEAPTLLVTPADDRLVGDDAARDLLSGIRGAREVVLPATGHMFRFTHPDLYGRTISDFVLETVTARRPEPLQGSGTVTT